MTATTTVNVAFVNQPKNNPKFGSIKTEDGMFYSVPANMLSQFSPKSKVEITYTSREYQGKTYYTVSSMKTLNAPSQNAGGGYGAKDGDDLATAERIFVCGGLNASIRAGQVSVTQFGDVKLCVDVLRGVWAQTFGGGKKVGPQPPASTGTPPPRDDMEGDCIPF